MDKNEIIFICEHIIKEITNDVYNMDGKNLNDEKTLAQFLGNLSASVVVLSEAVIKLAKIDNKN